MITTIIRINVSVFQVINVDLSHIESKVAELIKTDRSLVLIQGELIEKYGLLEVFLYRLRG
jgi:hypothetical protein